jgi:4-amino-4-deoxy-L-arabinose transferase-like glycosyltransferase
MINAEIAIKARKAGFKIAQVGVNHYPRVSGKPTGASLNVIFKSFSDLFKLWWKLKDQKSLFILLCFILILASFLRFYKIDQYMTFLGDEGRDALIMKKIQNFDFPLIGPPTSIGNIYLGPLYYYMMFIPMSLTGLNPVSAAAMNAFIGVITVGLIYYLSKIWFGRISALIASFFYAISPVTINYSRSSWNPNPAPFFALITIFSLYRLNKSGNFKWLILTGISLAAALQMHYLSLILIPVAVMLWFHEVLYRSHKKFPYTNIFKGTAFGIIAFFAVMSPLIVFDLKHDFMNYKALVGLVSGGKGVALNIFDNIERIPMIYSQKLVGRYIAAENSVLTVLISILLFLPLGYFLYLRIKRKLLNWALLAIGIWMIVGLFGISFYRGSIYDHYLNFLNPAPFMLLGAVFALPIRSKLVFYFFLTATVIFVTLANIQKNPLLSPPNSQLQKTQNIARFVIKQSFGEDYNFALISKNNYDSAYQFYLEQYGRKPKVLPFDKTNQLIVVCEDEKCDPIYSPKHEIASFGWTTVSKEWEYSGVKIYKLIHNQEQNK